MSIRCEIHFGVGEGETLVNPTRIYKHFDGHPKDMVPYLKEFIGWNKDKNRTDSGVIGANFIHWAKTRDEDNIKKGVRNERGAIEKMGKLLQEETSRTKGFGFKMGPDYAIVDSRQEPDGFVTYAYVLVYHYRERKKEDEELDLEKTTITVMRVPGGDLRK